MSSCRKYLDADVSGSRDLSLSDGGDLSLHQHEVTHGQLVTMSLVPGTDRAVGMQLKHGTVRGAIEKNTYKYVIIHASRSVGMLLGYATQVWHSARPLALWLLKYATVRGAIQ